MTRKYNKKKPGISLVKDTTTAAEQKPTLTKDSFVNFAAQVGIGTNNQMSYSGYALNALTRNRTELEWMYRGSSIAALAIDLPAEDMCRAGLTVEGLNPDIHDEIQEAIVELQIWNSIQSCIKWSRLYGGAAGYIMIDGQDPITPLNMDTVGKDQFKGIMPLDRWQLQPDLSQVITDLGPDFGLPKYYNVVATMDLGNTMVTVHHSRIIRFLGIELPYNQAIAELKWGESILERLFDKLISFDSVSQGAAQLVYKAHIRVLKIEGYREIIAGPEEVRQGLIEMIAHMRLTQSNESMAVIDGTDTFETFAYNFSGLDALLDKFGEQIAGDLQIPITRLFGASPGGMNATGDSDLATYYDGLSKQQESKLRVPFQKVINLIHRSLYGTALPKGTRIRFNSLYQLSEKETAELAEKNISSIIDAVTSGIITADEARLELNRISYKTGLMNNIEGTIPVQVPTTDKKTFNITKSYGK